MRDEHPRLIDFSGLGGPVAGLHADFVAASSIARAVNNISLVDRPRRPK
jgi:hypothetical protein